MSDLVQLWRARLELRQAYESVSAFKQAASPAVLGSIDQADDIIVEIMRKGARRALMFGAAGKFKRQRIPTDLISMLAELGPETLDGETQPEAEPDAKVVKLRGGLHRVE